MPLLWFIIKHSPHKINRSAGPVTKAYNNIILPLRNPIKGNAAGIWDLRNIATKAKREYHDQ